ncbi:MAG: glycoside hydrolase family 15 protein [Candidatus Dormibacteraeota bacterium]|nr:glycoside hydrolase family 15 protein [Candidatus Dormibacteraeota bacterium]
MEAAARSLHPLRDYALIADGERGALVGPEGELDWLCFPRWHDGALFASLLGGRGRYAVTPLPRHVRGGWYEPGTLIWRRRWITDESAVECREALALPTSPTRAVILRRLFGLRGRTEVQVILDAAFDYGAHPVRWQRRSDGAWEARAGGNHLLWAAPAGTRRSDGGRILRGTAALEAGTTLDLVLILDRRPVERVPDPVQLWRETEEAWRQRVPELRVDVAPRDARQAVAVLTGLTSQEGGMVAAATTSLPESQRHGRSYDYRYAWIRDQCFAGHAAAAAEFHPLLDRAVRYVTERVLADGDGLHPAYLVDGSPLPPERRLDLPGYPSGTAIAGNQVRGQFQLDALGEALLLFGVASERGRLDGRGWRAVESAAAAAEARWQEPESGIWEIEPRRWTHSHLIVAAGLRAVARVHPRREQAGRWLALADTITAEAARGATHPSGRWQRAFDDTGVDASLMVPALRGAVPAHDPRTVSTLRACLENLTEDGYVFRFRAGDEPLGREEGAFLLCGFWLSLALLQQGDEAQSAAWFERTRSTCGPSGLFCEEFDVEQRQPQGNLPQAFVHALLLEAAATRARR